MAELLDALAVDRARLSQLVVVTGSNGKTVRPRSARASARHGCAGLFTSPHLRLFNERFQIDGASSAMTTWRG
jgi:folylpolyglutamate synthase/dihydropteroate synthase